MQGILGQAWASSRIVTWMGNSRYTLNHNVQCSNPTFISSYSLENWKQPNPRKLHCTWELPNLAPGNQFMRMCILISLILRLSHGTVFDHSQCAKNANDQILDNGKSWEWGYILLTRTYYRTTKCSASFPGLSFGTRLRVSYVIRNWYVSILLYKLKMCRDGNIHI